MSMIFQVTISGKDGGGYLWQNVIHVRGSDTPPIPVSVYQALADFIDVGLVAAMTQAKADSNIILNIGVKEVLPGSSFTYNHPVNEPGTRSGVENVGAIAGKITEYPESGTVTGRMFVNGCLDSDFVNDTISTMYEPLLAEVADALNLIDGTDPGHAWELVIFNKVTSAAVVVDESATVSTPGVLSKRVRS